MLRLLTLVTLLSTASIAHAEPVVIERDALNKLIEKAEDSAKNLEKNLAKTPLALQPKGMRAEIDDLRDELKKLRTLVQKAPPAATPPAPTPPAPRPCLATATGSVMDPDAFKSLLGRIAMGRFPADQLSTLFAGTRDHLVTMAQTRELLGIFQFAQDKRNALNHLVPRLSDYTPAGRDALLEAFQLPSDKQAAAGLFDRCQ